MTLTAASLEPLPEGLRAVLRGRRRRPGRGDPILGVLGGATPIDEVFNHAHIDAFLGGSVPA